jgi:hypothetical protein
MRTEKKDRKEKREENDKYNWRYYNWRNDN